MAEARLKWDQLPQRWRDISVFLPRIATILEARFPSSEGFEHEAVSRTEYRVRRGFFRGLDVRVWRQEDLIIHVSSGSRLGSLLPGIAAVVAAVGVGCLVSFGPDYGIHVSFEDGVTRRMSYLVFTVGFIVFLILWVSSCPSWCGRSWVHWKRTARSKRSWLKSPAAWADDGPPGPPSRIQHRSRSPEGTPIRGYP
jgi:hypothetical protein